MSTIGKEYLPNEIIIAACVALAMPVWAIVLLSFTNLDKHGNAPAIAPGDEIAMKVNPVLDMDSPLLKKGGKPVKAKLPAMWSKKPPPRQTNVVEQKAYVSTKAEDSVDAIPEKADLEVSDAGKPPDEDAEVVAQADLEDVDETDPDDETAGGEGTGEGDGTGEGSAAGSDEGTETDPLKGRAANQYHARIHSFLYQGWGCPAGAPNDCSASAAVTISGLTVSGVSFNGCGNPIIDGPAKAHAQGKVGQSIPPPPEKYPDMAPSSFTIVYRCK